MKRMKHVTAAFVLVAASFSASAQSSTAAPTAPPTLSELLKSAPASPEASGIADMRFLAIQETAMTYGAQAGLARRSHEIQERLLRQAANLDVIYNFQALMIEGNVVPPIISQTSEVYDQTADDMLRVIDTVYRIEQQPRFTYAPPTWRAYLLTVYDFDRDVVVNVAPQSAAEKELWTKSVQEGFRLGVQQAEDIFKTNQARLDADIHGMIRYHKLLEQGLVTKPFVASSRRGVVRAENGAMHIGEVFLRITAAPDFVEDPTKWKAGKAGSTAERLKRLAEPGQAEQLLRDAREAGIVRDRGR